MMRTIFLLTLAVILNLGCARVRVEAPKEPIKVDIAMRLDIYQHVQKDIDAIEDIVSGAQNESKPAEKQSLLEYCVNFAYAQEGLSPEVEEAALRRKDRYAQINSWQEKGIVGENKLGLLEVRDKKAVDTQLLEELIKAENNDRVVIYQSLAKKNNTSLEEIQKIYAERLQRDVPTGTPIEVFDASRGIYAWKVK